MRDPRIDQIADAIEKRFPETTVVIRRCPSPDDPDIDWTLHALNLPLDQHEELAEFSLRLGTELFGENQLPYLEGGVTPEWSALHYSRYLGGEESARP
jgi:hypothetical protein